MPSAFAVSLLVAAVAGTPPAAAQEEEADLWQTQLELGFNGSSGNSSFSVLRTGGALKFLNPELMEFELSTLFRYGKSGDEVISNDLRGTVKWDWKPASDFSPFAFVNARRDRIRKLDAKVDGGAGAKWTFLRRGESKVSLSAAGMVDYENYALEAGSTDPESEGVFRMSFHVQIDQQLSSTASLRHQTFWQPEAGDFGDYNVEMTNAVTTQILSNLTLALEHEYLHDEVPPPDVKPDDQKFSAVLRVTF